jgi:hypothetical protein
MDITLVLFKGDNNEKLPEIPKPKQTIHGHTGGGIERVTGLCDHTYKLAGEYCEDGS